MTGHFASPVQVGLRIWSGRVEHTQLAKTGYHTGLIHFVQYFMEESVCMGSEGHVEPVDE